MLPSVESSSSVLTLPATTSEAAAPSTPLQGSADTHGPVPITPGPEFLQKRICDLLNVPRPWFFARLAGYGTPTPNYSAFVAGNGLLKYDYSVASADIVSRSWIMKQTFVEFLPNSPAVLKLSPLMPPDVLQAAFGDAVGHGSARVEFEENSQTLDGFYRASFPEGRFSLDGYKRAIRVDSVIFSDDTVESLYTELAIFRAAARNKSIDMNEFIPWCEGELRLLLARCDSCADAIERTNGSARRRFAGSFIREVLKLVKDCPTPEINERIETLARLVDVTASTPEERLFKAYQKAGSLEPESRREASLQINAIFKEVYRRTPWLFETKLDEESANARPGCGSAMRSGCIGRVVAQSLGDPQTITADKFNEGLSLTAMLALSLSSVTHPQAGACLASAVHAVSIYLISLDVPLHMAQEIALALFQREDNRGRDVKPGSDYYQYIKAKLVPYGSPLEPLFQANWDDSYKRMRCGLDMRRDGIFDSSGDLLKFKAQIMASPSSQIPFQKAQTMRPTVVNKTLNNPIPCDRIETEAGSSDNWPGNSVDMPILAMQCVHLALKENVAFMDRLKAIEGKQDPHPSFTFPHVLRKAFNEVDEATRASIDARITQLACFTQGDKDSIGAQAKLIQGLLFGIDRTTLNVALSLH